MQMKLCVYGYVQIYMWGFLGWQNCSCWSAKGVEHLGIYTVLMRGNQPKTPVRCLLGLLCTHLFHVILNDTPGH